ncbi:MAG: DUF2877 domain-containing protein [Streptosporangiaceae bacterium]
MTSPVMQQLTTVDPEASRPLSLRTPVPGAASLAVREQLERPRRAARVIAVFPSAVYLQFKNGGAPNVLALVSSDAVRPPNAVVVPAAARQQPFAGVREGEDAWIGDGCAETGQLRVKVRRWWDPSPVLGPVSLARLHHGAVVLEAGLDASHCGLAGHPGPRVLAERCAAGDLAHAVLAVERIVGLGPGLTPSGDDIIAGILLALRLLGGAVHGGDRAVWLADWLGAAVTADAETRTTSLSASLLHCAAAGQAGAEVAAVLRGVAGQEPLKPAVRRLLNAGHTSGSDLTWGLLAGYRATFALSSAATQARRATA